MSETTKGKEMLREANISVTSSLASSNSVLSNTMGERIFDSIFSNFKVFLAESYNSNSKYIFIK